MFNRILIANRGEVALRLVRAVRDLGASSVAVYAPDDAQSPHVRLADDAAALSGAGPAAYLDAASVIAIARERGCDAVHPGYGFLSERADFAQACAEAGLAFIGPSVEQLALFGDKARARALARQCGVPLLPGSAAAVTLAQAQDFFAGQAGAGVMIKALGGGGGRGMRAVLDATGSARGLCPMRLRSAQLRRRGRLRRAADAQRPPHRGAGDRRRRAFDEPGRARMHAAAALPETGGDRAQPDAVGAAAPPAASRPR